MKGEASMNPTIESKLSDLSKQRAEAIAGIEAERAAWIALDEINPPELPRFVHSASPGGGYDVSLAFEIDNGPADNWRERVSALLASFPPVERFRFKDGCLGYPVALTEKNLTAIDNGHAESDDIAPFVVEMDWMETYGTRLAVNWISAVRGVRYRIEFRILKSERIGASIREERANNKKTGRLIVEWPFRTYRVDTFWSPPGSARYVAWWDKSMCWEPEEAAQKWMDLTIKANNG